MTIYLDAVFLLNFAYDLLLLMTVDVTLKRNAKLRYLVISALIGAISLGILFLPFNEYFLFMLKVIVSIVMVLVAFGYRDIKYTFNNIFYLYMCSVILGGFLYYLDIEFSYKHEGVVFFFDGLNINYLVLLIVGPIILWLYSWQHKRIKKVYSYNYDVKIVFKDNKEIKCRGYLDTGNKLRDSITNKYIILVEENVLKGRIRSPIYVPYKALNRKGLLECISIKYMVINDKIYNNYLVGVSKEKFNLEGINCILNNNLLEDLC